MRAETARHEFEQNGVGPHLVTVYHKDVCRGGGDGESGGGGFGLPASSVDAVFLDLPEPWLAVPHAAHVLKVSGRIATYSPCVEQTQRTCATLARCGFHSIRTFEYRLQEHYVDQVEYDPPPAAKCSRTQLPVPDGASAKSGASEEGTDIAKEGQKQQWETGNGKKRRAGGDPDGTDNETKSNTKKKFVVARPFVMMRGHSAFLTFATAGCISIKNSGSNGKK